MRRSSERMIKSIRYPTNLSFVGSIEMKKLGTVQSISYISGENKLLRIFKHDFNLDH